LINKNPSVRVRRDDSIGTIVIDRVDRCNAVCNAMVRMILQGLEDFSQDKSVKVVAITGAGEYFCAGTDLKVLARQMEQKQQSGLPSAEAMKSWHSELQEMVELIEVILRYPKPVVAVVNGPAIGFGAALVMACQWTIASKEACLWWPETSLGLVPGLSAPLLSRQVGPGPASWWLSSGQKMEFQQAFAAGLFHQESPQNLLWAKTKEIAESMAGHSTGAIANVKRLISETVDETLYPQLSTGAATTAAARTTIDAQEKVPAFSSPKEEEQKETD